MFGLFSRNQDNACPIDINTRLWMENAFLWMVLEFGKEKIVSKKTILPTPEYFDIQYNGSMESLIKTGEIVARQMEVDLESVNLRIYNQNIQEIQGDFGFRMFTKVDSDNGEKLSSGLYFDKNEDGKFDIFIEQKNLKEPEFLVATLAHEFGHIKILGEKRLDFNDEALTDLSTVIFGLGIFNSNCSFKEYKTFDSHGHRSIGYLKQREWGYALALYAYYRKEKEPEWIKFLTPNIWSDFKRSEKYIYSNMDKILKEDYKG